MSVYTEVETAELNAFLTRYEVGRQTALTPVRGGITNTNYFVDTESGRYVLTLYEHHDSAELDFILPLQQHLAAAGVNCAAPLCDLDGLLYCPLNQRPAALICFLPGESTSRPSARHCRSVGAELARFHLAGEAFSGRRPNPRGGDWLDAISAKLEPLLSLEDQRLIAVTLEDYRCCSLGALPSGAIHADLFHDNALFTGNRVGIVDFDYACNDVWVLDLAVVINDWCIDPQGKLQLGLVDAFIDGYRKTRPLEAVERTALPLMLRTSALRFWLSRLHDQHFPLAGPLTFIKDPLVFRNLLVLHGQASRQLVALFDPH